MSSGIGCIANNISMKRLKLLTIGMLRYVLRYDICDSKLKLKKNCTVRGATKLFKADYQFELEKS